MMALPVELADLNRRHCVAGLAEVISGESGLPKVRIALPQCAAEIYLHGAHVTSWKPAESEEVFFLSPSSQFSEGKAIRGGVPICFPWFGDKADSPGAPAHGLVRTRAWSLDSIVQESHAIAVTMSCDQPRSRDAVWPQSFHVTHRVTFGAELALELIVTNNDTSSQKFEEAQHAYYRLSDVRRAGIVGLDRTQYLDKTAGLQEKIQDGDLVLTGETDRIYLDTEGAIRIDDPDLKRRIIVRKRHSRTTVVWNPWQQKAASLADLGPSAWISFVCVETSNVERYAIELAPGQSHTMTTTVAVEPY